jgi:oligopeptide/dipeptide ABC transporter ATP-binding protein
MSPLVEVTGLAREFDVSPPLLERLLGGQGRRVVKAVDGVSFTLARGTTLALVGESGCGKSTVARVLSGLYRPTRGQVLFDGQDVHQPGDAQARARLRPRIQMIFQDPADSLNSRHTVGNILEEPFIVHGIGNEAERRARVGELLRTVGLPAGAAERFPFEFSGGQRQRIGIARAIALNPRLVVCDEPVSALDVSIQSQVLNLMLDLQRELKLSYLFIAHDLAVVKHISDRIVVMYLGHVVETASAEEIYRSPRHPYTRALISAIPVPNPRKHRDRIILQGDVPSPINPPSGCPFHTRCPHVQERCRVEKPALRTVATTAGIEQQVACHFDL